MKSIDCVKSVVLKVFLTVKLTVLNVLLVIFNGLELLLGKGSSLISSMAFAFCMHCILFAVCGLAYGINVFDLLLGLVTSYLLYTMATPVNKRKVMERVKNADVPVVPNSFNKLKSYNSMLCAVLVCAMGRTSNAFRLSDDIVSFRCGLQKWLPVGFTVRKAVACGAATLSQKEMLYTVSCDACYIAVLLLYAIMLHINTTFQLKSMYAKIERDSLL